jgi:hypothetical protein
MNKTMMLVTSTWDREKTFKLIPVSPDSPYNEGIFDPENKVLAVISKEKKQTLHMIAKLNEFGDPQTLKIGRRPNGKEYSEERKTMESFYEYYLENAEEIKNLINMIAINADSFDYAQYLTAAKEAKQSSILAV